MGIKYGFDEEGSYFLDHSLDLPIDETEIRSEELSPELRATAERYGRLVADGMSDVDALKVISREGTSYA